MVLGKVEKCILRELVHAYQKQERKSEVGDIVSVDVEEIMMTYFGLIDEEEIDNLTLYQKQTVYNAITRLKKKGYVEKDYETVSWEWEKPPDNRLQVSTWINKNKIHNHETNEWEDLKNLIGA